MGGGCSLRSLINFDVRGCGLGKKHKSLRPPHPCSLIHFNLHKSSKIGKREVCEEKKGSRWNIFISVQVNNFPLDLRKAGKSLGPIRRAFYWPQSRKSQHILHYWDREQESVCVRERQTECMVVRAMIKACEESDVVIKI